MSLGVLMCIIDVMPTTGYYYCDWHKDGTWFITHCHTKTASQYNAVVLHSNAPRITTSKEICITRFKFDSDIPENAIVVKLESTNLADYPELFI